MSDNRQTNQIYARCLILELAAIVNALLVFRFLGNPAVAGLCAGTVFLICQIGVCLFLWVYGLRQKSLAFWLCIMHLAVFSIPLMLLRLLNWGIEFQELALFGLPARRLHGWSSGAYLGLIVATVLDWWRQCRPVAKPPGR